MGSYWNEAVSERYRTIDSEIFKREYLGDWITNRVVVSYAWLEGVRRNEPRLVFATPLRWPETLEEAIQHAICKAFHDVSVVRPVHWDRYDRGKEWWCRDCDKMWPWFPKLLTLDEKTVNALAGREMF
jgi:hypothetical protein